MKCLRHTGNARLFSLTLFILLLTTLALGCTGSFPTAAEFDAEATLDAEQAGAKAAAKGLTRLRVPEDETPPFYGRMTWSDDWAVLFLYRPPACVGFGVDLADVDPAAIPQVFGCVPLTIAGFILIEEGALTPKHATLREAGPVPVWVISRADFDAVLADDGRVTREEMEAAASFRTGTADFYHETLHPTTIPGLEGGGHPVPSRKIQARGQLDDDTPFRVQEALILPHGLDQPPVGTVSIDIG